MEKCFMYGLRELKFQMDAVEKLIQVFNEGVEELQEKFHQDKEDLREAVRVQSAQDSHVAQSTTVWMSRISIKIDKKPATRSKKFAKYSPQEIYMPYLARSKKGGYKERVGGRLEYVYNVDKILADRMNSVPAYEIPLLRDTLNRMNTLVKSLVNLKTVYVSMLEMASDIELSLEGQDGTV